MKNMLRAWRATFKCLQEGQENPKNENKCLIFVKAELVKEFKERFRQIECKQTREDRHFRLKLSLPTSQENWRWNYVLRGAGDQWPGTYPHWKHPKLRRACWSCFTLWLPTANWHSVCVTLSFPSPCPGSYFTPSIKGNKSMMKT